MFIEIFMITVKYSVQVVNYEDSCVLFYFDEKIILKMQKPEH